MTSNSSQLLQPRALYRADPMKRIELIRAGIPASSMKTVAKLLHISQLRLCKISGIPRSTLDSRQKDGKRLSIDQSERLLGILLLVGQVEEIVANAREPTADFDAGAWVSAWLDSPVPALGHRTPGELMDTAEGRRLVSRLLAQSEAGSYV